MNGSMLPPMPPKPYKGKVTVEAQSFGFIVVPQANVQLCVDYFANVDSIVSNTGASYHSVVYFPRCKLF
uniref:Uncharacterized protein n=2 Tax=Arion vulgaris TaxID=1028688 RepID=A0A0B7AS46_9EUPU